MGKLQLISCRTFALLFASVGVVAVVPGLVALFWAAIGIPADLEPHFEGDLPAQVQFFLGFLGICMVAFGLFHVGLAIPARIGKVWPLVVGTLSWTFIIVPSLGLLEPSTRTHGNRALAVLLLLTLTAVVASSLATTTIGLRLKAILARIVPARNRQATSAAPL